MMKKINIMKHTAYLLAAVSVFSTFSFVNPTFASNDQEDIEQTGRIVALSSQQV